MMKLTCPMLVVADIRRSRVFYETVLEQMVILDFGENITFDGGFSLQEKGLWAQFLGRKPEDIVFGGADAELYFETEDFDSFLNRFSTFPNVPLVTSPTETSWGQRLVRFCDPDRHIIEVGESMPSVIRRFLAQGLSVEEAARRSQHPVEFVRRCMNTGSFELD